MNPEAIDAAAKAIWDVDRMIGDALYEDVADGTKDQLRIEATAAIEAAVPYLIREARAAELEAAAAALDLPGSSATGYYSGNNDSGYLEAENHTEVWLRARAAAIRTGVQ